MIAALALLASATLAADGPKLQYSFEDQERPAKGHIGAGLALDGTGGITLPGDALHAGGGFALDMWLRLDVADRMTNVLTKDSEYLLRIDPEREGGQLSFFVFAQGTWEPRTRGPVLDTGIWHHVVASWDGYEAVMWVDGRRYSQVRAGAVPPTDAPVQLACPSERGGPGVAGTIDEVKLYDRALGDDEVLVDEYSLDAPGEGPPDAARFEFDEVDGWRVLGGSSAPVADGSVRLASDGRSTVLIRRGLALPTEGKHYVTLRMSAAVGKQGELLCRTTEGLAVLPFALKADGAMHTYVFRMDVEPCWTGSLRALALTPTDERAEVAVDFLRIAAEPDGPAELEIHDFLPEPAVCRADRPTRITARLVNVGGIAGRARATLTTPEGVAVEGAPTDSLPELAYGASAPLEWTVRATGKGEAVVGVTVRESGGASAQAIVPMRFTQAVPMTRADYVPPPDPAPTDLLVGCHYCPLWKEGSRQGGWEQIVPFPEREPALGWYDEDNPEVTDWEVKWALEHGISFFVYCWYRAGQGGPVQTSLGHAIHDGLMHARYGDKFHFTIMWENQARGYSGISDERDLLENLLPWWIENYFKNPSYLKVDNKPVLFIYRPEYVVEDLGGIEQTKAAFSKAREACRAAGFDGLILLGEYRGTQPEPLKLMADIGLDYTFAYCWPVGGDPSPQVAIDAQEGYWRATEDLGIIPQVVTLSAGWDSTPWSKTFSAWKLPPDDFRRLCERGREFVADLPADGLGHRMILLDNWNEFGEGHYIAPHRQDGFGQLDAVRDAFSSAPREHVNLVPEDVGLGPYDKGYRAHVERIEECKKLVVADQGVEPGLAAWYTFDEPVGTITAWDYSGNRRGGLLDSIERVPGRRGSALACEGGSVNVWGGLFDGPWRALSVEAWLRTATADQEDKWFVNCIYGDGGSGFRFGLSRGCLAFAIPKTPWSHHLVAAGPLPLGRWVHVAATFDGRAERIYMDGREVASMPRQGPVRPTDQPLCVGNFAQAHRAHFTGLLDDVRIYSRALSADEIAKHAAE